MALTKVNIGLQADDPAADPIRTAFEKLNENVDETEARLLAGGTDIGDSTDYTKGAGMVGFQPEVSYSANTVGNELKEIRADTQDDLDVRLRFDAAQTLTALQKVQATSNLGWRERLTTARTYYVRQDGSDTNDGLTNTAGGAFLTLNRARDAVYALDLNGKAITIQLQVSLTHYAGTQWDGHLLGASIATPVTIQGDSSNVGGVIVTGTSTNAFRARSGALLFVKDLEVRATGGGIACMLATEGGHIIYDNIRFGPSEGPHKETSNGRIVFNSGVGYFITGDAVSHEHCTNLGYILNLNGTATLIGTRNFSSYFYGSALNGVGQFVAFSYLGSTAIGQRYFVWKNSTCDSGAAADPNFFPGSIAGATSEGGRYL